MDKHGSPLPGGDGCTHIGTQGCGFCLNCFNDCCCSGSTHEKNHIDKKYVLIVCVYI